jgi:hypothetical protein
MTINYRRHKEISVLHGDNLSPYLTAGGILCGMTILNRRHEEMLLGILCGTAIKNCHTEEMLIGMALH